MANDHTEINAQIARLRALSELPDRVVPKVAAAVREELEAQIGRGETPDGEPWKLTAEGKRPLRNAAAALSVGASGRTVVARLEGHHARHDLGAVRGKVRRQILPREGIPDGIARAIDRVVTAEFARTMGAA